MRTSAIRIIAGLLLSFILTAPLTAQPPDVMPARVRLTPASALDISLYMLLSRRAERVLWSPGGSILAVVDAADIDLYSVTDWLLEPRKLRLDQAVTDLAFSPDGTLLYTLQPGSVVVWSVTSGAVADRLIADARRIAVSPDGVFIALLARQNAVQIVKIETRETYTITPTISPDDVTFDDDQTLVITDGSGGAEVVDLPLRRTAATMTSGEPAPTAGLLSSAAVSADGRRILSQAADSTEAVWVWDKRTGEKTASFNRPAAYQLVYGWGQNTRSMLVVGAGIGATPETSAVLVWHFSGGDPVSRLSHPGVRDAQISPDGTLIASVGGGALRLWAAADALPTQNQAANVSQVNVVAACNVFGVQPSLGQVLDGQSVSLVWSWFAATEAQVRDYLDAGVFRLDLDGVTVRPWTFVTRTLPDAANDNHPTVYLYAPIGPLTFGEHRASVEVTWVQPVNDGFDDYGPGTANLSDGGGCSFTVR